VNQEELFCFTAAPFSSPVRNSRTTITCR